MRAQALVRHPPAAPGGGLEGPPLSGSKPSEWPRHPAAKELRHGRTGRRRRRPRGREPHVVGVPRHGCALDHLRIRRAERPQRDHHGLGRRDLCRDPLLPRRYRRAVHGVRRVRLEMAPRTVRDRRDHRRDLRVRLAGPDLRHPRDHPRVVPALRRHLPDRRRLLRVPTSTSGGGCSSSWARSKC